MLPLVTKNPDDQAMYDQLATLGLKSGRAMGAPSKLAPATRTALAAWHRGRARRDEEAQRRR